MGNREVVWDTESNCLRLNGNVFPYGGTITVTDTSTDLSLKNIGDTIQHNISKTEYLKILKELSYVGSEFAHLSIVYRNFLLHSIIYKTKSGKATGLSYCADGNLYGINIQYTDVSATVTVKRLM